MLYLCSIIRILHTLIKTPLQNFYIINIWQFKKVSNIESMTFSRLIFASSKESIRILDRLILMLLISSLPSVPLSILVSCNVFRPFIFQVYHLRLVSMESCHHIHEALIADVLSLFFLMYWLMAFLITRYNQLRPSSSTDDYLIEAPLPC